MADRPPFWARVVALVTACAVGGAAVGTVGGLVVDRLGVGLAVGVLGGAVAAVALVLWTEETPGGRGGPPD